LPPHINRATGARPNEVRPMDHPTIHVPGASATTTDDLLDSLPIQELIRRVGEQLMEMHRAGELISTLQAMRSRAVSMGRPHEVEALDRRIRSARTHHGSARRTSRLYWGAAWRRAAALPPAPEDDRPVVTEEELEELTRPGGTLDQIAASTR